MRLTTRQFEELVRQALEELPSGIRNSIDNVAILVEEWPSDEELEEAGLEGPGDLFGLYRGVPLPEREGLPPALPDTITLYQGSIELACHSREQVAHELRVTLLHEVGHYLGMSEEDLESLGYG